jgi:GDPmannose 4,6-dehydratase
MEATRIQGGDLKVYRASISELYGNNSTLNKNENSKFKPSGPDSAAKIYGYWISKLYREAYDVFVFNGVLFSHESPLRGLEFVIRKVTNSIARIKL